MLKTSNQRVCKVAWLISDSDEKNLAQKKQEHEYCMYKLLTPYKEEITDGMCTVEHCKNAL